MLADCLSLRKPFFRRRKNGPQWYDLNLNRHLSPYLLPLQNPSNLHIQKASTSHVRTQTQNYLQFGLHSQISDTPLLKLPKINLFSPQGIYSRNTNGSNYYTSSYSLPVSAPKFK